MQSFRIRRTAGPLLSLLVVMLLVAAACSPVAAQQRKPRKSSPSDSDVNKGKKFIDQAYVKTRQKSFSVSDYSQVINLCVKGTMLGVSQKTADYATKLMSWAHNRRGKMYAEAASEASGPEAEARLKQQSLSDFETSLKLDDSRWNAHYNHGVSMAEMGKYEEALADLNRSIELHQAFARAYFNRGQVFYVLRKYKKAIVDYNRAIRLDSQDTQAFNSRGHALYQIGRYREALRDYDRAVKLDPRNAAAYTNRGDAFADQGNYEGAASDYRRAINLDSKFGRAYQSAAWLMATCPDARYRDKKRAIAAAEKAIRLDGADDYRYLDSLAAAYANAGRLDDAVSTMKQVIKDAPEAEKQRLKKRLAIYEQGKPYREGARVVAQKSKPRVKK